MVVLVLVLVGCRSQRPARQTAGPPARWSRGRRHRTHPEKDATYRKLRRPDLFRMGYKLYYDEGVAWYQPHELPALQPEYVSYRYRC
jgi:hypothetical protein